jgi:hypothetical protein
VQSPRAPEHISRGSGHASRKPHRYEKTHVSGHSTTEAQTNAQQLARGPLGRVKGSLESPRPLGSQTIVQKPPGAEAPITKVSASTRAAVAGSKATSARRSGFWGKTKFAVLENKTKISLGRCPPYFQCVREVPKCIWLERARADWPRAWWP